MLELWLVGGLCRLAVLLVKLFILHSFLVPRCARGGREPERHAGHSGSFSPVDDDSSELVPFPDIPEMGGDSFALFGGQLLERLAVDVLDIHWVPPVVRKPLLGEQVSWLWLVDRARATALPANVGLLQLQRIGEYTFVPATLAGGALHFSHGASFLLDRNANEAI